MRTTPSRFSAFVGEVDPTFDSGIAHRAPSGALPVDPRSVLEQRHPAVIRALTLLWGYPEMNQYFEKAWSGQDASLNLEPEAMAELMMLAGIHQRICPYRPAKKVEELYGPGRWADTWRPARPRR